MHHPGPFLRYMWDEAPLNYYNVFMGLSGFIASIVFGPWFMAVIFGILLTLATYLFICSYVIWQERMNLYLEYQKIIRFQFDS